MKKAELVYLILTHALVAGAGVLSALFVLTAILDKDPGGLAFVLPVLVSGWMVVKNCYWFGEELDFYWRLSLYDEKFEHYQQLPPPPGKEMQLW